MSAPAATSAAGAWAVRWERGGEGLARLTPEWEALLGELGDAAQPFLRPDWIEAQVGTLENPARLEVATVRREGRLRAVLPLIREWANFCGLPVRRLRSAAGVYSVRFDLLAAPGAEGQAAAQVLADALSRRQDWDVLELRDVPQGGAAEELLRGLEEKGHRVGRWLALQSPYIDLGSAEEAEQRVAPGFAQTSKKFRQQMEAGRRGLAAAGHEVSVRRLSWRDENELGAHLARFYQLEHSGWKGRKGTSILARRGAREFYDRAGKAMARHGSLILHELNAGGHAIAMCYGLLEHGRFYVLKWSYDEAFARYGPGHLLIEAMLRDLTAPDRPRLRRFDITGGDEPYKQKWTKIRLDHNYLFGFRRGVSGAALHQLKFRVIPQLRRPRRPA